MNRKFFQKSVCLLVTIFFVAISFLPLTDLARADSFTQTYTNQIDFGNWTLSGVDKDSISGSLVLSQLAGGSYGSYSTTDISKKDTAKTNATWNSDGSLVDAGTSSVDLRSKLTSVWGESPAAQAKSIKVGGGRVYVGGLPGPINSLYEGSLGFYNPTADTYTNLTSKVSWLSNTNSSANYIYAMAWDSTNNVLHFSGGANSPYWSIYNPATDSVTNLTIPAIAAPGEINKLSFNSGNGKIYAGTSAGLWVYDPASGLVSDISTSSGTSSVVIHALAHDSVNNLMLIGGSNGKFLKYNYTTDSSVDLTNNLGWGASITVEDITVDGAGLVYVSGGTASSGSGQIYSFNLGTLASTSIQSGLTAKIRSSQFDSSSNTIYFAGLYLYKYLVASSTFSTVTTGLSGSVDALSWSSSDAKLYLGAQQALVASSADSFWFGFYNGSSATDKSSTVHFSERTRAVQSLITDPANEYVYIAGNGPASGNFYFAKYNIATDTMTNIPTNLTGTLISGSLLAFDTTHNSVYISGGGDSGPFLYKYNVSSGVFSNLSSNLPAIGYVDNIAFNAQNSTLMIAFGGSSKSAGPWIRLYNTTTDSFVSLTLPAWPVSLDPNEVSLAADGSTGDFYMSRQSIYAGTQKFYKYSVTTSSFTDLTPSLSSSFQPSKVAYNSYDNTVYLGSSDGRFFKYNIASATATEFTSALSSFWGSQLTSGFAIDNLSNTIYISGYRYLEGWNGKFAQYDPDLNTATNLTGVIASWATATYDDYPLAMAFDSSHSVVYIAGTHGHLQKYILGSTQIKTTSLSSSDIKEVFLSSASTPTSGKVKHYASNNGGTTFSELTSSSPATFSSSGNDLQVKTVLVGGASISAPTVAYSTASVVSGTARFIFSSLSRRIWQSFVADSSAPSGSSIVVSYRTADTQSGLDLQNFVQTSGTLAGTSKYIEFSIQLIASGGVSPALRDFQLVYQAEAESVAGASSNNPTATPSASPSASVSPTASPSSTSSPLATSSVSPSVSATPLISPTTKPTITLVPKISPNKTGGVPMLINISETITENSSGKYVSIVQGALKDRGYLITITKDGTFDDNTRNAVATLQKDNGINPLKIIGPRSKAVLNNQPIYTNLKKISATEGKEILSYKFSQALKLGDENPEVSILQKILYIRSFFFDSFSGYFGPLTKSAIEEFQKAYGLDVSGQLDKNTQDKLNSF